MLDDDALRNAADCSDAGPSLSLLPRECRDKLAPSLAKEILASRGVRLSLALLAMERTTAVHAYLLGRVATYCATPSELARADAIIAVHERRWHVS